MRALHPTFPCTERLSETVVHMKSSNTTNPSDARVVRATTEEALPA
jgi:hypothetical protein